MLLRKKNVKENKNQPVFLFDRKCRVSKLERLRTSSFIIQISLSRFFSREPQHTGSFMDLLTGL